MSWSQSSFQHKSVGAEKKVITSTYNPPEGYSRPRTAPTARMICQNCDSEDHWTYECTKPEGSIGQDITQGKTKLEVPFDPPPPDTRNPLFRYPKSSIASRYSASEIETVKNELRAQIRREIDQAYRESDESSNDEESSESEARS